MTRASDRHAERMKRARIELTDAPKARSHAERMAAARGVHVHGDNMRILAGERRRIAKHRNDDE